MKIKKPPYIDKDLHDNDWLGVVESIDDPLFSGRARVRVFRLFDDIESDLLPWATAINSATFGGNGAGSLSVPKVGTIVRVQFNNGDITAPEYTVLQEVDTAMIEQISEDYEGTHVILYDPDANVNVMYQRELGFRIFHNDSFVQISPDSMITIQHANSDSLIQLVGEDCNVVTKNKINISAGSTVTVNADEVVSSGNQTTKSGPGPYNHAVLGEPLMALLNTLASAIDSKTPPTPGANAGIVKQARQSILSRNVLISR